MTQVKVEPTTTVMFAQGGGVPATAVKPLREAGLTLLSDCMSPNGGGGDAEIVDPPVAVFFDAVCGAVIGHRAEGDRWPEAHGNGQRAGEQRPGAVGTRAP